MCRGSRLLSYASGCAEPIPRISRLAEISSIGFLEDVEVVEIDDAVCRMYGEIQWDRTRRGTRGPGMDMLIASCALAHGLTLVTGNLRHFSGIPGLNVENWLVS